MIGVAFQDLFLESIPEGGLAVDLGSGIGKYATQMAEQGHHVIAVDQKPYPVEYPNVEFVTSTVQDWLHSLPENFQASAYLVRNLIQFMDKDYVLHTLFPQIAKYLVSGGIIGIVTFTKQPEPAFDPPHKDDYNAAEILAVFDGWDVVLAEEVEEDKPDMGGTQRHFYITRLIIRKP